MQHAQQQLDFRKTKLRTNMFVSQDTGGRGAKNAAR
jgi:hypothetical protein